MALPIRQTLRAVVRQLAAAVYAVVATAMLDGLARGSPAFSIALELGLVALAAAIVSFAVAGPLWTSALVGLFVGLIDLVVVLALGAGPGTAGWLPFVGVVLWPALAGLAGAVLVRLVRRHRARDAATP